MTIATNVRRAAASIAVALRPLVVGGPVGAYYALRLAWLRRRLAKVRTWMHREDEVHREHVRALDHELNELVDAQQRVNVAAGQFWRACGEPGSQA